MQQAKLLVNWYKPTGKWYAGQTMYVPTDLETWDNQHVAYVEEYQTELQSAFTNSNYFMTISCIEQDAEDIRFFERLIIYPRSIKYATE